MKSWVAALGFTGVGFFISGCIIGGLLGGLWLDNKFDTRPAFIITGLILGIAFAFYGVYSMVKPLIDNIRRGGKDS